jgi:hypothetical protein
MSQASYHQTVLIPMDQAEEYDLKAQSQEERILRFMRKFSMIEFTCESVESYNILPRNTPHSSYIRALANLLRDGKIKRCGQVKGRYGRPIHAYRVIPGAGGSGK